MSMKLNKPDDIIKEGRMIDRFQKKVFTKYPNAILAIDVESFEEPRRVVKVGDVILQDEYFLPNSMDEFYAWYYASLSVKVTQQFNRTHPDKLAMDFGDKEAKAERINRRSKAGKKTTMDKKRRKRRV